MTPETRAKKTAGSTTSTKRSKKTSTAKISKVLKSAVAAQHRSARSPAGSYSSSTEVAQVRLRPDEMADLRLVMQSLNLTSVSDALREGLRLLSREAAEVAASEEIRAFYQGAPAPAPAGVLPATADELAAGDEIEW